MVTPSPFSRVPGATPGAGTPYPTFDLQGAPVSNLHHEDLAELAYDDDPAADSMAEEDPNLDIEPEITNHPAGDEEPF